MKRVINTCLFALFVLSLSSCDDDSWVLSENSNEKVIEVNRYGVTLRYCLLNEQREPAISFQEGENFTIFFSIKNNRKTDLVFDNMFPPDEIGHVYSSNGESLGHADGYPGVTPLVLIHFIHPGQEHTYSYSWINEGTSNQQYLPKGSYSTGFGYTFDLSEKDCKVATTDKLSFRINFTVL